MNVESFVFVTRFVADDGYTVIEDIKNAGFRLGRSPYSVVDIPRRSSRTKKITQIRTKQGILVFVVEVEKFSAVDGNDECRPSVTFFFNVLGSRKLDFVRDLYGTKRCKMQRLYSS